MVNTTVPILKKLMNHMEETVNNNSRKNSYGAELVSDAELGTAQGSSPLILITTL